MKYALIILALIVAAIVLYTLFSQFGEGESGESTVIGNALVVADYGYAGGGDRLLYAVIRSFPTNATQEQKSNDSRFKDTRSGVLVRDNNGRMVPVGRDGNVYLFDGNQLRVMKVKAREPDVGIANCTNMDQIWTRFRQFEVH